MRLGLRTFTRAATALLLAGAAAGLTVAPAAAQSHGGFHGGGGGGFHGGGGGSFHGGGGFGGYRGGYGGYHGYGGFRGGYYGGFGYGYGCCGYYGGFGFGDALLGAALIGTTAAVIASDSAPTYYETYPAPVYPAYPPPAYAPPPAAYGYAPPPAPQPGYPPQGYQDQQPQQQAYQSTDPVDQCSRAAVNEAASRGDSGRVTKIDRVDGHPNGARVTGTIEVRRTSHNGEVENARFTCTADYGQVTFFRFG